MKYFSYFVPGLINTQVCSALSIDEAQLECTFDGAYGFREIKASEAREIKASW